MIPKPLDKIESADILALVTNADEERRTMDFKLQLPGNADRDKHELRADVTSFANAGGGDLIFGVDEAGGVATAVPGLPGVNANAEILRLESIIQSCVDPRVPGVGSWAVSIPHQGPVIVVRVPKSWRGPHLVKINDTFRMFGRNSKGKYSFDATEIRMAFNLSEQLPERLRRWHEERMTKINQFETPVTLDGPSRLVIHLLPLSTFTGRIELPASALTEHKANLRPPGESGSNSRVNIDGLVTFSRARQGHSECSAYCQIFRSGHIEAVSSELVQRRDGRSFIPSVSYEEATIKALTSYLAVLRALGVPAPVSLFFAMIGTKGSQLAVGNRPFGAGGGIIDRNVLSLPDVIAESFDVNVPGMLRPVFDVVWNAAGWERCFNYDENGKWSPKD